MIVNERIRDYLHSLESDEGELCDRIAREARAQDIPIIKKETAALLKTLVAAKRPGAILEVGTAVGYSALLMAGVMPPSCKITTIEKYAPRIRAARENFREASMEERIVLLEGDAEEILPKLKGPYDFIFMDAAKGQYIHWLPVILGLMPEGGMLFSDNVLQDGSIVQSRYGVERRDRTIHSRMREYLYTLKHMEGLESAVIPIGDGAAVSVRTERKIG
ncbi:MAG: O-methyltransferase [Hungatella sp.]|nr:O-methyltransferase [Hungatella sp.]